MTPAMLILLLFCIVAEAAHEICFKYAADSSAPLVLMKRPLIWLAILFWGIYMVAWINVLEQVPLSVAFPVMSLVYVVIVAAGALILKEKVNVRHAVGALLITIGVACIGLTGQ
ncbi:MAG: EamA family transporter [Proteobacteria bacterium]|nr:EamA family transporter [Pseudomonadota bacterium]